jgi:ankyrin repeat protein
MDDRNNDVSSTDLIDGCRIGDLRSVADLLRKGADPNTRTDADFTALMVTAMFSQISHEPVHVARLLIEVGADPNAKCRSGASALSLAVEAPCFELVKLLLDCGASLEITDESENPLISASDLNILKLLLDRGANPLAIGRSGKSAIEDAEHAALEDISEGEAFCAQFYAEALRLMCAAINKPSQ